MKLGLGVSLPFAAAIKGATAWTPAQLETSLWLDFSDSGTVTSSAGLISACADKSIRHLNASQGTGSAQPQVSTLNGLPACRFDTSAKSITLGGLSDFNFLHNGDGGTIVCVARFDPSQVDQSSILSTRINTGMQWRARSTNTTNIFIRENAVSITNTTNADGTLEEGYSNVYSIRLGLSQANHLQESTNGTQVRNFDYTTDPLGGYDAEQVMTIGDGAIYTLGELIIFSRLLTDAEIELVEGYLAWKWGTVNNLREDHSYKHSGAIFGALSLVELSSYSPTLWLDASDMSTFPVTSGAISSWNDKSGNDDHALQATVANQPTIGTTKLNRKNVVVFDGSDDQMTTSAVIDDSLPVYAFLVAKMNTDTTLWQMVLGTNGNVTTGDIMIGLNETIKRATSDTYSSGATTGDFDDSLLPTVFSVECGGDGSTFTLNEFERFILSKSSASVNADANIQLSTTNSTRTFDGYIAEVLITQQALSADDIQFIVSKLAWKWGQQSVLDEINPYRYDGRLLGGPKLWTPAEIQTTLWIDPSDTDIANITSSGGAVSSILDKSPNSMSVTQSVTAEQPNTGSENVGRKNVLTFDGGDALDLPDFSSLISGSQNRFVICVARIDTPGGTLFSLGQVSGTPGKRWTFKRNTGGTLRVEIQGTSYISSLDASSTGIFACGLNGTTLADHILYANGVGEQATGTSLVSTDSESQNTIGNTTIAGTGLDGVMGEMIVLDYFPDDATRQNIEGYLAHKYNLQGSLPSTHPYRYEPPRK